MNKIEIGNNLAALLILTVFCVTCLIGDWRKRK